MNPDAGNHDDREPTFQMTAMVDVVFMLLAFFVLASQFDQPERDVAMGYSEDAALPAGIRSEDLPSHIPIQLRRSGAGVAIQIGQASLRDDDFDGIQAKLSEINMPSIGVRRRFTAEYKLRILAEAELSVEQVTRALDAVLASPMKLVSLSKLEKTSSTGR